MSACGRNEAAGSPERPAAATFNVALCSAQFDAKAGASLAIPVGGCLASPSKTFAAVMMPTGALDVAAVTSPSALGAVAWSSNSHGSAPSVATGALQEDGNLVVYDAGAKPIWASGTGGSIGAYRLQLSDVGELTLSRVADGQVTWSSRNGATPPLKTAAPTANTVG